MIEIPVCKKITTIKNADNFQLHSDQEYYLFTSERQRAHIFNSDFQEVSSFAFSEKFIDMPAISTKRGAVTVIQKDNGMLNTVDKYGEYLWSSTGNYIACCYDDQERLWAVQRISKDVLQCEVFDLSGKILFVEQYEDILIDSMVTMNQIPNSGVMNLEHAAGQDGCVSLFFEVQEDQLSYQIREDKRSLTLYTFNQLGDKYVCLDNDDCMLYLFSYPEHEELGKYYHDSEEQFVSYFFSFLDNHVIFSSSGESDRYHCLDLQTMQLIDEVVFEGYSLKLMKEVYPTLNEDSLTNPISYFVDSAKYLIGCSFNGELVICRKNEARLSLENQINS